MSAYSFPFQDGAPFVTITLVPPDSTLAKPPTQRETFAVDTGFSDYLQVDWETFCVLRLQTYVAGTLTSELADGSSVIDLVALIWAKARSKTKTKGGEVKWEGNFS